MGVNLFFPRRQQIPGKQNIHQQRILFKEASCSLDCKISVIMSINPESKPLTKQSYQTVPIITMSDEEEPLTNNTKRVAESNKRKYGYAVLTSGILFVLLMASAAFNNKNGGKSFASHLKTSHVVPTEGSGNCYLVNVFGDHWWSVKEYGENVKEIYSDIDDQQEGFTNSKDGTCRKSDGSVVGRYTLNDDGNTLIVYNGIDIVVEAYDHDGVDVYVDYETAGTSMGYDCKPIDILCAVLLSDNFKW